MALPAAAAASSAMLSLDLLGPVALRRDGLALPLTVRKTAALLVLLALGGPMPRGRIVALLWPSLDEPTGRRNLRRELARLREIGAEGVLSVDGDRLALAAGMGRDLAAWAAEADPESALGHWRGPPADGLELDDAAPFMDWLAVERERLLAQWRERMAAAASRAAARGDVDAALARLDRLLADDPLQERHHRQAMAWLAAAGRREEALARYARCSALLRSELGLAPMAETEALAAALRGASAAPAAPPPARPALPAGAPLLPDRLPFVGREAEVAGLERAWRAGGAVLIEGEGGVGKTRLALDFAAAHGPVALVRCHPADAEQPLASIARALRVLAGPEPAADGLPPWVRDELPRLLPALGAAPPPLRSEAEHGRFVQALALAWRHWAQDDFDAVVLDDWHLADAASQALLPQLLAPVAGERPLRTLLVYRSELDAQAAARLARLREAGAPLLRLQPLAEAEVLALLQQLSGAARPERFARRLLGATGGHPFHIAETLQHLADLGLLAADAAGVWHTSFDEETEDYRELPVPASVREAVLGRVRRLPEPAQRMLDAATLAGEPFDARLLAPACALSEVEGDLALEAALAARLLQEHPDGGFGFVHDLVPQSLAAAMAAARRRLVHRRLALGAEAAGAEPARIAAHFEAGGEPRRALPWRCRAAEGALRLHALDEAIAQWQRARADGGEALTGDEALAIGRGLLRALELRGDMDAAHREAMALLACVDAGEGSAAARVDATIAAAGLLANCDEDALALARLDGLEPLHGVLTARQQAAALRVRADALRGLGRIAESQAATQAALSLPALPDDDRAKLLDALTMAALAAGRLHDALAQVEAALALSRAAGDTLGITRAAIRRAALLVQVGDPAEAEAALRSAAEQAGRLGMTGQQRATLFNLCVLHANHSRPAKVLAVAQECRALPPPMPLEALRTQLKLAFVEAHVALGDLGQAWHWLQGAMADALAIGQIAGLATCVLTGYELLALLGEQDCAEPLLAALGDAGEAHHFLAEMRVVRAECALLSGDPAGSRAQIDALQEPLEVDRVRLRRQIVVAALRAADGDAAAALAALPPDDAPGHNDELRWRALAVRIGAEAALGALHPATRAAAAAALTRDGVHAVAQWLLHRALARALASAGTEGDAAEAAATCAARTAGLAASLASDPERRNDFLRRWG